MNNNLNKLVIAGPGAGKTYSMVDEVMKVLPNLDNNRFCVVITYTNAATDKIRNKMQKKIKIPENVFIGTIY
jgi:DNA helicase-2/ATP-dependent DNA helicase PcrA